MTLRQVTMYDWNTSGRDPARLSPLVFEQVNFHGRYPIVRTHANGQLRALRPLGGEQGE
jgi:hypothetical protein